MYGIKCAYEVLESLLQPEARACRANWFYKQLFDELVNILRFEVCRQSIVRGTVKLKGLRTCC